MNGSIEGRGQDMHASTEQIAVAYSSNSMSSLLASTALSSPLRSEKAFASLSPSDALAMSAKNSMLDSHGRGPVWPRESINDRDWKLNSRIEHFAASRMQARKWEIKMLIILPDSRFM